jgi:hypothetical protein
VIEFLPSPRWVQTPLGEGLWLAIIDYGISHNPLYLIELIDGQHRVIDMREVRGLENYTFNINRPDMSSERDKNI